MLIIVGFLCPVNSALGIRQLWLWASEKAYINYNRMNYKSYDVELRVFIYAQFDVPIN